MSVGINTKDYFYSILYKVDFENKQRFVISAYKFYDVEQDISVEITDHVMEFLNSDIDYFNLLFNKQLVC